MTEREHYSYQSHSPQPMKGLPWPVCARCGLVFLRNKLTAWCIKLGCNHELHSDWPRMLRTLGGDK